MSNNLLHKRNLIILIGVKGLTISALKHHKVQKSIFIEYKEEDYTKKYRKFLKKYKKFHIVFLLDHKECKLKHEIMPILSSIIKNNPVEKFVRENYQPEDIVAHTVYEIDNQNGEVWHTCIASVPLVIEIKKILGYVITNSYKFCGMYFLSLELKTIIERILQKTKNTECSGHLQVFVTITEASNIRIAVKYKNNIMDEQVIDYPHDKSNEYIQGTIEQTVSDKLLAYKEYIEQLQLNSCVIFLVDSTLKELLSKSEFTNAKTIALSRADLSQSGKYKESRFQDNLLFEIFDNFNTHLALNAPLKSVTKLTLINNIIFKPLIALQLGVIITLAALKYQTIIIKTETEHLNQKYYSLSQEYRDIKKRHPNIKNISDLADLYNFETILSKSSVTPFTQLKHLLASNYRNLRITNINWKVLDPQNINLPQSHVNISLDIVYEGKQNSIVKGIETLNEYANHLKTYFSGYTIVYKRDTKHIRQVAKKTIIPAHITIDGTLRSSVNAK